MTNPRLSSANAAVVCDINITPLIDVMLVLLVTLIVSLPIMTHAVKLDLPRNPPSRIASPPAVIQLDIDFDDVVAWNGAHISAAQLQNNLQKAAAANPQPEIHLTADRHAKYDSVAKLLALVQRSGIERMGFVNTGEFSD